MKMDKAKSKKDEPLTKVTAIKIEIVRGDDTETYLFEDDAVVEGLYDDLADYIEEAKPEPAKVEDEDEDGESTCPYCGTTLKLLASQGLEKAECPGCGTLYEASRSPRVSISSNAVRKSRKVSSTGSVLAKVADRLDETLNRLEVLEDTIAVIGNTPKPRKISKRLEKGEDEAEVQKADTDLSKDMEKAQDLVKVSQADGKALTAADKAFVDRTLDKSLAKKVGKTTDDK